MSDEERIEMLLLPIGLWLFLNMFPFLFGMLNDEQQCQVPLRRIEYVIPGYRFGCWLTEVPK